MVRTRIAAAAVLALGMMAVNVGLAREEKKADAAKEKLIGVWAVVKSADLSPKDTVELTKDAKVKLIIHSKDDKTLAIPGTWSVDGTDLKITMTLPDGKEDKQTLKIIELTDTKLVTKDKDDKLDEFKKVPAKVVPK